MNKVIKYSMKKIQENISKRFVKKKKEKQGSALKGKKSMIF